MLKYPTHLDIPEAPRRTPTPTPWTVGPHPGNEAGTDWRTILASGEFGEGYIGEALQENAALIVRAVNSHAALAAACQEAFDESCRRSESNRKWTVQDQRVHEKLKAALALAKEGQP